MIGPNWTGAALLLAAAFAAELLLAAAPVELLPAASAAFPGRGTGLIRKRLDGEGTGKPRSRELGNVYVGTTL